MLSASYVVQWLTGLLCYQTGNIFRQLFSNGKFSTTVYRKPTFTGLFTDFESFIPITYKRGLINSLSFSIFQHFVILCYFPC